MSTQRVDTAQQKITLKFFLKAPIRIITKEATMQALTLIPGESGESAPYTARLAFPKLAYQDISLPLPLGLISAFGNVDVSSPDDGELDDVFTVPVF
jgi:hypothetical protein